MIGRMVVEGKPMESNKRVKEQMENDVSVCLKGLF